MEPQKINQAEKMKDVARNNFAMWNDALQTKDAQKVAELYSSEASFLPTVAPEFKNSPEETEEYFKHFLEKNPAGKIVEDKVQVLSEDSFLHSGLYDFQVVEKGVPSVVEARFSFVWQKNADGEWKIIHHHSSQVPGKKKAEEKIEKAA